MNIDKAESRVNMPSSSSSSSGEDTKDEENKKLLSEKGREELGNQLKAAWEEKRLDQFKELLADCDTNQTFFYRDSKGLVPMPLLCIMANNLRLDTPDFVEAILMDRGTLKNEQDSVGNCPIHYAATKGNWRVMTKFMESEIKIDSFNISGMTALHILSKTKWSSLNDDHKRCMQIILSVEIETDDDPVNILSFDDGLSPIQLALHWDHQDAVKCLLEFARDRIYLDEAVINKDGSTRKTARQEIIENYPSLATNLPPIKHTEVDGSRLFQMLRNNDENKFCEQFSKLDHLRKKTLLTYNNGKRTFLQYACEWNYKKVTQILLEAGADVKDCMPQINVESVLPPMMLIIKRRRLEILRLMLKICSTISSGDLYQMMDYALYTQFDDGARELLKHDQYAATLTEDILKKMSPKTFESLLDNKLQDIGNGNEFSIQFNYDFLVGLPTLNDDNDNGEYNDGISDKLQHLITLEKECPSLHPSLIHPVLNSYIFLKWDSLKTFITLYIYIYCAFCTLFTAYLITGFIVNKETSYCKVHVVELCFLLFSIPFLFAVVLVETVIHFLSERSYCMPSTWWPIFVILFSLTILIIDLSVGRCSTVIRTHFAAIFILLAWCRYVALIGFDPEYSVQIEMFRKVQLSYFKYLRTYMLLILAFALSFYVIFGVKYDYQNKKRDTNETGSLVFYHPLGSIVKTLAMASGEFEYGDISELFYGLTPNLIFILFIYFIVVVLLNLLNGLAVSDTNSIQNKAELYTCRARLNFIALADKILSKEYQLLKSLFNNLKRVFTLFHFWEDGIEIFNERLTKAYITSREVNVIFSESSEKNNMRKRKHHIPSAIYRNLLTMSLTQLSKKNECEIAEEMKEIRDNQIDEILDYVKSNKAEIQELRRVINQLNNLDES